MHSLLWRFARSRRAKGGIFGPSPCSVRSAMPFGAPEPASVRVAVASWPIDNPLQLLDKFGNSCYCSQHKLIQCCQAIYLGCSCHAKIHNQPQCSFLFITLTPLSCPNHLSRVPLSFSELPPVMLPPPHLPRCASAPTGHSRSCSCVDQRKAATNWQ